MDELVRVKEELEREAATNPRYLAFFIKVADAALEAFPLLNSSYDAERMGYETHPEVNIGVARQGLWCP